VDAFSAGDLVALGIGLDIAGAMSLARGLYISPRDRAWRVIVAQNTFGALRVGEAEANADAVIGGGALIIGVIVQAVAYALIAGGARATSGADGAAAIALLCTVGGICLVYGVARFERPRRTKAYLVEFACYQRDGRHNAPDFRELATYAEVLGYQMTPDDMANEATRVAFVKRVFGIDKVRLLREHKWVET
jgi:hypothetical protein